MKNYILSIGLSAAALLAVGVPATAYAAPATQSDDATPHAVGEILTGSNLVKYKVTSVGETNEVAVTYNDVRNNYQCNAGWYMDDIVVPEKVTFDGVEYTVTAVTDHAFYDAPYLTSIVLPETIRSIGEYAFYYCIELKTIDIPAAIETIPKSCFEQCNKLATVTGMEAVKTIGNSAFMSCPELKTLEGLTLVESLGEFAFSSDAQLLDLPAMPALKTVGRNAFSGCNSMTRVLLPSTVESLSEIFGNKITADVKVYNCNPTPFELGGLYVFSTASASEKKFAPIYVPYGSASTYSKAFIWNYSEIRELTPDVTVADGTAVAKNDAVKFNATVALGEGVKEENVPALFLAANDFTAYPAAYAAGLKAEYRTVGSETSEYAAATVDNGNVTASVNGLVAGDYEYRWVYTSGDNTEAVTDWKTVAVEGQKYAINQALTIDGIKYRITALGETNEVAVTYNDKTNDYSNFVLANVSNSSFYKNAEYVVPSTVTDDGTEFQVTSVDDYAFYQCASTVKSIKLSEGIRTVGYRAFSYNQKITSIELSETVKSIGDFAFDYCIALTTFDIPASVETIGEKSFSRCKKIETITGMEGVKTIGPSAFMRCTALNSIESLSSVETICEFAFSDDAQLLDLPDMPALKTIGRSAFSGCNSITRVLLPSTVESLSEIFGNNITSDVKVYNCNPTPIELGGLYVFSTASASEKKFAPIYVPYGSASTYSKAFIWKYSEIRELTPNVDIVDCNVTPSEGNATFTADVVLGQGVKEENVPALFLAANDFTSYPAAYAADLKVEYRLYGTEDSTIATGTAEGSQANAVATDLVAGNYEYRWVIVDGEEIVPVTEWDSFVNTETGIDGIDADTDAPVYYNLQGVRVVNPTAGIYLERKGNTMRKVVIK